MTKEEIEHLARLSRVALTPAEVTAYETQLASILAYVSTINEIIGENDTEPTVGQHYNVFRADEVTNAPETHTETLLAAMPAREGRFMKVKKILQQDE